MGVFLIFARASAPYSVELLLLSFVHPSRPAKSLGPFKQLWFDAESLRVAAGGLVLARHVDGQWSVEGESYYRLDCFARVCVGFERRGGERSRVFGPFARFSAVDGLLYTDDKAFALLDRRSAAWLCYDLGEHYPVMTVTEAPADAGASADATRAGA